MKKPVAEGALEFILVNGEVNERLCAAEIWLKNPRFPDLYNLVTTTLQDIARNADTWDRLRATELLLEHGNWSVLDAV